MPTLVHRLPLAVFLAFAGCAVAAAVADEPPVSTVPAPDDLAKLAAANNAFALDVFHQAAKPGQNEFLSPYSISSALAMTCAGAKGQTAAEMLKVMHLDLPAERIHAAYRVLTTALNANRKEKQGVGPKEGDPGPALLVANALWGQQGYKFDPQYIDLVNSHYGGRLTSVDFAKATEAARETINQWVEQQTREKIKDLIAKGVLDDMTRLVLTNAIYFKCPWLHPFKPAQTRSEDFTLADATRVKVDMMHQQERFGYFEGDDFQMLEMRYDGMPASLVVILPKKPDGLAALEKQLDAARLGEWIGKLAGSKVKVGLPKFRVEREYELAKHLKALGMTTAFTMQADFSGMTREEPLYISAVIHKTFIAVDEAGTEAAAATAVVMRAGATPMPEEPKVFIADRPFLFLIRDQKSGTILFLGRVMNPGNPKSSKAGGSAALAKELAAKVGLANLENALDAFDVDCGRLPSTQEGLRALIERPANPAGWQGPYLNQPPKDPWGREFVYRSPGLHNEQAYDLSSLGADGVESDDDITNWQPR